MIAQTTATSATSAARTTVSRLEVAGILMMMAGDGYINGNFFQPTNTGAGIFVDVIHLVPLALLLWLGIELLRPTDEASATSARRRGLRIGITILAVLGALTSLVMIALGAFVPSLGVGVQAFSDWLAVVLAGGGAVLWFASLAAARRGVSVA
jgi:hypothetical protein